MTLHVAGTPAPPAHAGEPPDPPDFSPANVVGPDREPEHVQVAMLGAALPLGGAAATALWQRFGPPAMTWVQNNYATVAAGAAGIAALVGNQLRLTTARPTSTADPGNVFPMPQSRPLLAAGDDFNLENLGNTGGTDDAGLDPEFADEIKNIPLESLQQRQERLYEDVFFGLRDQGGSPSERNLTERSQAEERAHHRLGEIAEKIANDTLTQDDINALARAMGSTFEAPELAREWVAVVRELLRRDRTRAD